MDNGFQFLDIVLFAVIAVFLILRLRKVLGRRGGHEGGFNDPFARRGRTEKEEDNVVHLPDQSQSPSEHEPDLDLDPDSDLDSDLDSDRDSDRDSDETAAANTLDAGLAEIGTLDQGFNAEEFISGARVAFDLILGAYAAGDARTLKPLLSGEVFGNFAHAIKNREQAGETMDETLISIKKAEMVEAYMEGTIANVTVKFVSEQVNVIRDENGDVIDGDPNAIIDATDFWTFARDTRTSDPNWALVTTRSLE